MTDPLSLCRRALAALAIAAAGASSWAQTGDYILAIVNQELVTASELQQRMARVRDEATRNRTPLPPAPALRQQVLDALIDERVLVTNARETGPRIDEPEIDRAVASVANQNQLTVAQLRERLGREGITYARFRDGIRDQMLVERVREREVVSRIRVTDAEVDAWLEERRKAVGAEPELNIAQVLVTVPEGASEAVVAERRERAAGALRRIRAGEDFAAVSRELSEDGNRAQGGEIGLRPMSRLPDLFTRTVSPLKAGEVRVGAAAQRCGLSRRQAARAQEPSAFTVAQTRARHILLRPSAELTAETAARGWRSSRESLPARAPSRRWHARIPRTAAPRRAAISAGPPRVRSCGVRRGHVGAAARRHFRPGRDPLRRAH